MTKNEETNPATGHTPGPWEASTHPANDPEYCHVWAKGRSSDIALVVRADNESMIGVGSAEANARLMAAAPDMLAALRALTHQAAKEIDQSSTHDGLNNCDLLAQARAAIAKAEGGAS